MTTHNPTPVSSKFESGACVQVRETGEYGIVRYAHNLGFKKPLWEIEVWGPKQHKFWQRELRFIGPPINSALFRLWLDHVKK